jgi:hypothetical protein
MKNKGLRVWVDDSRPAPKGWIWAKNAEEAKIRLLSGHVEDLSLDFDLDNPDCPTCQFKCGYQDGDACGKTCGCHDNGAENGGNLVEWMVHWQVWPKHKPVIHSTNGEGSEKMKLLVDANFENSAHETE